MSRQLTRCCFIVTAAFSLVFSSTSLVTAQLPTGWRAHDLNRPAPTVVDPGPSMAPANVPSDAIVLFDGSSLNQWGDGQGNDAKWKIVNGAMESVPGSGYVYTKEKFGDCQLHVEWASPSVVKGDSQGRGNSGVYLMSAYEIQVLDSFDNKTYADGSAGSVYGQYPPLVNASRKPGEWQTYDIIFHRPRFDDAGKLTAPATVTVLHNGVLIQDHSEIFGPTNWIQLDEYKAGVEAAPLGLQDHGNPVRYRNIWIRPLVARAKPEQPYVTETGSIEISEETQAKVVGDYDGFSVVNENGTLFMNAAGRKLEMLAISETKFEFHKTAGSVEFKIGDDGNVQSGVLMIDAMGKKEGSKK